LDNVACHFVYYTGPRKGDAVTFNTARITIGKANNADFRLDPNEDQVGNEHAEILLEDGNVYRLYDLGVKAGTYVNGERVHDRCTLLSEDYIRFSQDGPEIIFRVGTPPPGKQKLPLVFPVTAEMEFFSGSDAGRIFPINAAVTTNIGRRAELEIPLDPRGDMIVSGNHCNIRYLDGHFVLTDSSRNGTYVNGDLVEQPMEIIDGDVIMLGDGGPQARFHVDLAKRHYPNHRPLSPVAKPQESEKSAFKAMPSAPATPATPEIPQTPKAPDTVLASAAPFATGTAPLQPTPKPGSAGIDSKAGAPADADAEDVQAEDAIAEGDAGEASGTDSEITFDDTSDAPTPTDTPALTAEDLTQSKPEKPGKKRFAPGASMPKLAYKPGKKAVLAAIGAVVIIGLIALLTSGDDDALPTGTGRGDYAGALKKVKTLDVPAAGFQVSVPEGWTAIQDENTISAESNDKQLALDYMRDPRLTEDKIRQMLGKNGASVSSDVKNETVDGVNVKLLEASIGDVRRLAALHQPADGVAAAALLETTEDVREKLDDDVINRLLVENLKLTAAPAPVAPPQPTMATPGTEAALPTPTAATPSPAVAKSPEPTETPAPTLTPAPTPAPTQVAAAETTEPAWGVKPVKSKALNLTVGIPNAWKGVSEEADAMLTLTDNKGLEIRIARDDGDLDPKATFEAMEKEGWSEDGQLPDPRFQAAEFSREDQNLLLVLIPEKPKTTLVIYATSAKDFTGDQRTAISKVILQILPGE